MNLPHMLAIGILFAFYIWVFYNIPILLVGVKNQRKERGRKEQTPWTSEKLPLVSLMVPVKDEEKVIGRLLEALLRQNYPREKMEIVIVEDGSIDSTVKICNEYAQRYPNQVKLIHQPMSDGKPSALNHGLKYVKSEIVAVFDADNVPEPGTLLKAVEYLTDNSVAAVQGRIRSINPDQNMLTKLVSYEEAIAFDVYLRGKDALNLFVPLTGSCYFIKRRMIEEVGGWSDKSLCEDLEMSVRLALKGERVKYAPDIQSQLESSANITQLVSQRLRWFRGSMEVAFKYGKLAAKLDRRTVDVEFTLAGAYAFLLFFLGLIIVICDLFVPVQTDQISQSLALVASKLSVILLLITGMTLVYVTLTQRKATDLLLLPFICVYWIMEAFVAAYAFIQLILRRPRKWKKTKKEGVITNSALGTGCWRIRSSLRLRSLLTRFWSLSRRQKKE